MSIRGAALLALLIASIAALLAAAPAVAATEVPPPLSPDGAQTLATTGSETSGSTTMAVNGVTALNASTLPDADTSIEAGVSAQAAVGLTTTLSENNLMSASRPVCWANAMWHQWGTWPYQQRITDTTYWCAVYGSHITYRSSTTTASGLLCGVNWRARQLIAGGVGPGFTYFTMRSSAGFSCQTVIPWITIHTTHHEDVKRNVWGATKLVGSG